MGAIAQCGGCGRGQRCGPGPAFRLAAQGSAAQGVAAWDPAPTQPMLPDAPCYLARRDA
jgi:hypothetical protein